MLRLFAVLIWLASSAWAAPQAPGELAIRHFTPVVDGELSEWKSFEPISFRRDQVFEGAARWRGVKDASADFLVSWDNNRLYLAGTVRDDQNTGGEVGQDEVDCIELHLGPGGDDAGGRAACRVLRLFPLQAHRPWAWGGGERAAPEEPLQPVAQLAGITVVGRATTAGGYTFEAAIPFHHFPMLQPGATRLAFDLVLRDHDRGGGPTSLSWSRGDPFAAAPQGRLRLPSPGLLAPTETVAPLLSGELLSDLPYLLVPILALVVLVLLLRLWGRIRGRVRWLRTAMVVTGVATFLIGLWLPRLMISWRAADQQERLEGRLTNLQRMLPLLEGGTLESYRGASRDRAVVDLVSGRSIVRQRYTSYRSLVDVAPARFGPPTRTFDDLPVRCYWLPLGVEHPASFQFDPPLQGTELHLVVARPYSPSLALGTEPSDFPRLDLELDDGRTKQQRGIELNLPFTDATSLGREFWVACVVSIDIGPELRSLTVAGSGDPELRLVGMSRQSVGGDIAPLSLGEPTRDGVLTDLRGPYPQDAGIELAPGATATVTIPEQDDPPEQLWLFYRGVYPRLPTSNPGARVAEVSLHFADGRQKRTIVLEHQVSMFYELAVHNTRDDPPADSPVSIALTWVDESQERHINVGYPVRDLPSDTSVSAIEFTNHSDYRVRFRSVVFVDERAVSPQDPPDSPLEREGHLRRLKSEALAELGSTVISIYRNGELSESTLPADQRQDVQGLPRSIAADTSRVAAVLPDGDRRLTVFAPLRGDGWDGAVLAISSTDEEWAESVRFANRLGLLLCLLSTPFLLVLLSELLAVVTNLRFRLMTVMSVASLAPLGLLSLVLVQVLESGHATELEEGVRTTVRSAMARLADEKEGVRASARQWLQDLVTLAASKLAEAERPTSSGVAEELQNLLSGQLPPEWRGGFLRLEWQPKDGGEPVVVVAGDERMVRAEAPARLDPGLFMQWGQLMLGVRAEQVAPPGSFALTAGRPLDGELLGALAPGHDLLLTDVRGYPLAASAGRPSADRLLQQAYDPPTMAERERALAAGEKLHQPVIARESSPSGDRVVGIDVLRDLQETPRGMLVVALPDERATLDLAIGRIPVRAFFLLVAGSLVVLAAFLSFVVSGRISRPIERLEKGAQALSRGVLTTRVPNDEGGQVGRLTRAFNQMAEDLEGRLQDLQALNRTMGDLAAEHDEGRAIEVLRRFCANHSGADAVVTTMLDESGDALVVRAGGEARGRRIGLGGTSVVSLVGPFCCRDGGGGLPVPWCEALPQSRAVLGLPIAFAGQTRGVVLLGFDLDEPSPVDLELLNTVVAQAASACERSQLQRLAVLDPVTGVFAPEYFHGRVVDEVSLARHGGESFALLAFRVSEQNRTAERLQRFVDLLRSRLPEHAFAGYGGGGQFLVAMARVDRAGAETFRQEIASAWRSEGRSVGIETGVGTFGSALAVFPGEAASAGFLFEAVRAQLAADPVRDAVEAESDASLLRAGVTAVSAAMRPVYSTLRRVAPTDLPILLEGETGVGKEVLTNLVHRWSRRSRGPLVKVHCASLSETLLASELFGHERGAFTGADRRKVGRFEQAHGGTLFLDEVGEIPHDVQVMLLRALQEGEIDRVGGTQAVKVDVRVIAATNRDIKQMVANGAFREDLYYRLQGMVVQVPPLRERREELPALVERFRADIVRAGHAEDRSFSTGALDELLIQPWPGNVRQLRTTIFRSLVLARGLVVSADDVRAALRGSAGGSDGIGEARSSVDVRATAEEPLYQMPRAPAAASSAPAGTDSGRPTPPPEAAEIGEAAESQESEESQEAQAAGNAGEFAAATADGMRPAAAAGGPEVDLQRVVQSLSPRLLQLLSRVRESGRYTTQDHMASCGISHRTALRDLQALVQKGLVERVGSRRGAYYRPSSLVADL